MARLISWLDDAGRSGRLSPDDQPNLDIELKDGRTAVAMADFGKAAPQPHDLCRKVATKFHGCAEFAKWDKVKPTRL